MGRSNYGTLEVHFILYSETSIAVERLEELALDQTRVAKPIKGQDVLLLDKNLA